MTDIDDDGSVCDIIPVDDAGGPPARLPGPTPPGLSLAHCPTSLDIRDPHDRALVFAAGNPGTYDFDGTGTVRINAVHWLVFADESEDPETGEIRQFGRLVLFDRDGGFFRTSSVFAPRRIRAAVELFSPAEWLAGVTFVISRRVSKRGRTYHDIRVAVE